MTALDFEFEFDDERWEAERLLVEGDVVEPGQVAFRLSRSDGRGHVETRDLLVPFPGVFLRGDTFGVARAEPEVGQDGEPVGVSIETPAANAASAENNARRKALAAGLLVGRVLFAEQIEAGKWEVVFQTLTRVPIVQPTLNPAEAEALGAYMRGVEDILRREELLKQVRHLFYQHGGPRLTAAEFANKVVELVLEETRDA